MAEFALNEEQALKQGHASMVAESMQIKLRLLTLEKRNSEQ